MNNAIHVVLFLVAFGAIGVSHSSFAKVGDCSTAASKKERKECLRKLDLQNEKHAETKTVKKPFNVDRNVSSAKQAEDERRGKGQKKELHFSKSESANADDAMRRNGLANRPRGSYQHSMGPGEKYREAKVAGAHGNKREILVDRRDLNKSNTSSMRSYSR
jgi:hypothetical protein